MSRRNSNRDREQRRHHEAERRYHESAERVFRAREQDEVTPDEAANRLLDLARVYRGTGR